jgi:nitroreductase
MRTVKRGEHPMLTTDAARQQDEPASLDPRALAVAMRARRSVKAFLPRPVPRAVIEEVIEAAVWAPNHRLTEPWRFYIFDGPARARLGAAARQATLNQFARSGAAASSALATATSAAAAWAGVPAVIYMTTLTHANPEIDLENYGAACCAAQNLMLAAHAAGLATSWSSGLIAACDEVRAAAGAGPAERMVGLFRLGYPDPAAPAREARRAPGAAHTTWVADGQAD